MKNFTTEKKLMVYGKYSNRCAYCGVKLSIDELTIDHIIPRSIKRNDKLENLNPCCLSCNCSKHDKSIDEWRERLNDKLIDAINNDFLVKTFIKLKKIKVKRSPIKFYFETL